MFIIFLSNSGELLRGWPEGANPISDHLGTYLSVPEVEPEVEPKWNEVELDEVEVEVKGPYCAFFNHRTLFGSVFWHRIESSTPDAISAQAFSVAERTAASRLFAFTVLQVD